MRRAMLGLILLTPLCLHAQESTGGPLFMKDMLNGQEFFEPWGVGFDLFTMDQDYGISSLMFDLPGAPQVDADLIGVANEIKHYDLKLDLWLTPFLNVFGILGHMDADTRVDLSSVSLPGLPFSLGERTISYDGTVYGAGFTLAYGSERWFTSLTNTWTDADVSGDFDSSVSSFSAQPRIGLVRGKWNFWVGGMYLDTDESHAGSLDLGIPGLPPIPFSVELETRESWNYAVGAGYVFSPKSHLSLEIGFGDRDHTLFNYAYRF